jgi:hypothetical protein
MKLEKMNIMWMEQDRWTHESCTCDIVEWDDWATIYSIESTEKGKWHAQALLIEAKKYYEDRGKKFGSSVSLSGAMSHILKKLDIYEYI